jgi:hypothetical protein
MVDENKGTGRLAYQFEGSTNLKAFIQAFVEEFNELEISGLQLLNERYLDTAVGVQLDGIGEIVGLPRPERPIDVAGAFGFLEDETALGYGDLNDSSVGGFYWDGITPTVPINDDLYRLLIRAKIIQNQTAMTVDDTLRLISFMFSGVKVRYWQNAYLEPTYEIFKNLTLFEESLLPDLPVLIGIEKAFYVIVSDEDAENTFSFDEDSTGKGYGDLTDPDVGGFYSRIIK